MALHDKDDKHGNGDRHNPALSSRSDCPVGQLEWFANGTLTAEERTAVEAHLTECAACQAEVEAWSELRQALRGVSVRTPEPRTDLFARVQRELDILPASSSPATSQTASPVLLSRRPPMRFLLMVLRTCLLVLSVCGEHFRAQARLIRRDLFWMPLLLVPLAGWIIYQARSGQQAAGTVPGSVPETAALLAALLTALGMAFLYGQEVDPAREMALATQTSPRLVLGVRCCLVFGYDLLLNCGVVLPLLAWQGIVTPDWFLTNWLAPLCCLSAIALLLSVVINAGTAVLICVLLCALRLLDSMQILQGMAWQQFYEGFWRQGPVLFVVALLVLLLAIGILEKREGFA